MSMNITNILFNQLQSEQIQSVLQKENQHSNGDYKVQSMTYNVRTAAANDPGDQNWKNRSQEVLNMIDGQATRDDGSQIGHSDFVSIQEAETPAQWDYIKSGMEAKGYKLVGGDDPNYNCYNADGNMLFYDPKEWNLADQGKFVVKQNNHSVDPDLRTRYTVWGHFQRNDGSKQDMYAFTSHFPRHTGVDSLQDVANDIGRVTNDPMSQHKEIPVLFMGDLNDKDFDQNGNPSYDSDAAFQWRGLNDTYLKTHDASNKQGTDHAWDKNSGIHREDLIFAGGVDWDNPNNSTDIIHYNYKGSEGENMTPSDHFGVVSDLYFAKQPSSTDSQPVSGQSSSGLDDIAAFADELDRSGQLDSGQSFFGRADQSMDSELF